MPTNSLSPIRRQFVRSRKTNAASKMARIKVYLQTQTHQHTPHKNLICMHTLTVALLDNLLRIVLENISSMISSKQRVLPKGKEKIGGDHSSMARNLFLAKSSHFRLRTCASKE